MYHMDTLFSLYLCTYIYVCIMSFIKPCKHMKFMYLYGHIVNMLLCIQM